MTSELKCPFCGKELVPVSMGDDDTVLYSSICLPTENCICNTIASKKIWQALIQAKQDLVIAKSTLEYLGYEFAPAYPEKNVIAQMRQKARDTVKYIEHRGNR